jgi:hypothetical protein
VRRRFLLAFLLSLSTLSACGGSEDQGGGFGGHGGKGASGGASASANGGTGAVIVVGGTSSSGAAGAAGTGVAGSDACATDTLGADVGPVNMFVMFDSSASMNDDNKWPSATAAFTSFFQDPETAGLRMAFRFFGSDSPTPGCNDSDCSIDACADPLIDIAGLTADPAPTDAHEAALVNLLQTSTAVGGFGTPIYPALGGAVQWASDYAAANPDENAVVVFVTDGEPNGCNQDIGAISSLAADGWNDSRVRTYAIGLEGSNEAQLDQIAAAGNTLQGYFIGAGATAQQDLLAALNEIRGNEIRCDIAIPPSNNGMPIDFNRVNVNYTPSNGGAVVPFGKVPSAADCMDLNGWYYDDPSAPTRIVLCDAACQSVNADSGAELSIVLGCMSEPPITR